MVETDTPQNPSPPLGIPTIAEMARGSKDNLMAISYSQRPKTPMRTYVVTGALMGAMGVSLGFGIYLMFNPDHTEYSASTLEGTPSVEHDQVLIAGLRKVVPMHNAPVGHNPTFGSPRKIEFLPTQAPISRNVPPPLINHLPPAPTQRFAPVQSMPISYAPGAASAAVPFQPIQNQGQVNPPVYDASHAAASRAYHQPMPLYQLQPGADQPSQGYVINKHRLQMVTTK
jgi:hypothetical protein